MQRVIATACTLLLISFTINGCGVYFYDKSRDKSAQQMSEAFAKATATPLFDVAAANLGADQGVARASARRLEVSRQDVELVTLVGGVDGTRPASEATRPAAQMIGLVEARMKSLVGSAMGEILSKGPVLQEMKSFYSDIDIRRYSELVLNTSVYYKQNGGHADDTCSDPFSSNMALQPPVDDSDIAQSSYKTLLTLCTNYKGSIAKRNARQYFGLDSSKFGEIDSDGKPIPSYYKATAGDVADLERRIRDIDIAKKAITEKLAELQKEYEKQLQESTEHPNSVAAKAALKTAGDDTLRFLDALNKKDDLIAQVKSLSGGLIDLSKVEKEAGVPPTFVGELVKAEFLGTNLQSLLAQAVKPEAKHETPQEQRAQAFYVLTMRAIDALSRLEDLADNPEKVPSPNALLIAIAHERYLQETARLEQAMVEALLQAKQAELDAMHREIFHLWTAHSATTSMPTGCGGSSLGFAQYVDACKSDRSARDATARALIAFDAAQSAEVDESDIQLAERELRRQYKVATDRAVAEGWLAMLKPAVDQLHAYGEGGIKPETIANVMQALGLVGLGAIGWGVN